MQPGPYSMPPPPPAMGAPPGGPIKPSGWWFVAAGVVGVGGAIVAIIIFVMTFVGLANKVDDFERVDAASGGTVTIDKTGDYTVYHEYYGADSSSSSVFDVDLELTDPDGELVQLDSYNSSVTYDTGSEEGVALYSFTANKTGDYEVTTSGGTGQVAIGRGLGGGIVGGIVGSLVVGFVSVVAAIIITVVVAVRRSANRRKRFSYRTPPAPFPPQPGYPGGPPPPHYPRQ